MASIIDASDLFGKVATASCMGLNLTLHRANGQKAEPLGKPTQIVLHWTAGDYRGIWDDYHFCVAFDRSENRACIAKCLKLTQKGQHLWKRNTGAIGLSFSAMADSRFQVTPKQIEAMALLVAELCFKYSIPMTSVVDHAFWAKKDGYFPQRWDIGNLLVPVKQQADVVLKDLQSGKRKLSLNSLL
jgi:hypothetical protein